MQQGDYPYYSYPNSGHISPAPIPNPAPSPPSYASAPPFSATYTPSSDYASYPPPYTYNNPDLLSTAPPPPPLSPAPAPVVQQPQYSSPFPSFESHGPYYPTLTPTPTPNSSYPSVYPAQNYDNSTGKFDHNGAYFDEKLDNYGNYGSRRGEFGQDSYVKRAESGYGNDGYGDGDGVYAYQGSKVEPYGARGTSSKSSTWSSSFDDFGRPIGYNSPKERSSAPAAKIVKAVPKVDTQQDVKSGVQKFRVKLLAESGGQSTQDVLCQIGLDGIRMLDPSTSRTLRIYPLDTITRCDVMDSSTLVFWSKSAVDIDPRRIRLQSNSYTTSSLLDTVTAATVQFKEMGGSIRSSESPKVAEQPTEKKKGLADWINIVKPVNEEKDHWVPDEAVSKCTACGSAFNAFVRKHHCRNCGDIFCDKCTQGRTALTADENAPVVRVCDRCSAEVSRRLSSAKETVNRSSGLHSHEDLAKKLQEEMERNRRESSGSRQDRSGRMKEVACPTCTVHLQVQVPSSGSETIECGVCQHPFLISSH
ncbi:putative GDSL esterase/lipase EXL3-like [Capsicum annuum]|nr:putative GDSL esterase/lipase EXL3-like [Capsicum annuum]KAF3624414.1 putative GDSL esterase/lipase EXL3-like [Capsicum annuum]